MSQSGERMPSPGVGSDLHEWAARVDARQQESHGKALQSAQDRHLELVAGMCGAELSDDQKAMLEESLTSLYGIAIAKAQFEFGPRLTDVFDGSAMNA